MHTQTHIPYMHAHAHADVPVHTHKHEGNSMALLDRFSNMDTYADVAFTKL